MSLAAASVASNIKRLLSARVSTKTYIDGATTCVMSNKIARRSIEGICGLVNEFATGQKHDAAIVVSLELNLLLKTHSEEYLFSVSWNSRYNKYSEGILAAVGGSGWSGFSRS